MTLGSPLKLAPSAPFALGVDVGAPDAPDAPDVVGLPGVGWEVPAVESHAATPPIPAATRPAIADIRSRPRRESTGFSAGRCDCGARFSRIG
ncbi:MAG TPA: hypothetical protein VG756_20255 [Pseudonocardiaceae bacterium]|nr:hypothetical protein [Pseudonocardiaceae bacterium]